MIRPPSSKRAFAVALAASAACAFAGDYRVERIASGLTQSNYVTQAPGDPSNILYIVERTQAPADGSYAVHGFNRVNHMGKVTRYDTITGAKTTVLDFYNDKVFQDDGLQSVAFSPDFQTTGKLYVTSSVYGGTQAFGSNGSGAQPVPNSRVQEYTMNVANPSVATTTFNRTILDYTNSVGNNHTIDWAGFDPTAVGAARNYLYVSTGDGSYGNAYNGGSLTNGRPSQNPASVRGKLLRLDVAGGDAYPADPLRNYAIPAGNPIPAYNAAHPAAPINNALGEVFVTGLRNSYRVSFDRANGNLYFGDVGENSYEEVDFLKAGTNTGANAGPVDFGWPQTEGTTASGISGAPGTGVNPFTGVVATNPIHVFTHNGGSAVIGGYVYRGPIAELQGKYFLADFVPGKVSTLDFDPNTAPITFNGNNAVAADVSGLLNGLVFDRNDPNYTAAGAGDAFGLDHVVSFGEDNAGNLYVVDFGGTAGDGGFSNTTGEYPTNGAGEIFRLVLNGDFDRNNLRNAADVDALQHSLAGPVSATTSRLFDLNADNVVLHAAGVAGSDLDYLIRTLLRTEYGDANLDRAVNFDDLLAVAQHYATSGAAIGWADGDFDGNNAVDFADLLTLAQHYGTGGLATLLPVGTGRFDANFAADWALAQSLMPEPATALSIVGIVTAFVRRRRVCVARASGT